MTDIKYELLGSDQCRHQEKHRRQLLVCQSLLLSTHKGKHVYGDSTFSNGKSCWVDTMNDRLSYR